VRSSTLTPQPNSLAIVRAGPPADVEHAPAAPQLEEPRELERRVAPAQVELVDRSAVRGGESLRVDARGAQSAEDALAEAAAPVVHVELGRELDGVHAVRSDAGFRTKVDSESEASTRTLG
jgi:hypothetical protein